MANPDTAAPRGRARGQPGEDLRWPASAIWRPGEPLVRRIGVADLRDAISKGVADFMAVPSHAIFLCLIYPVIGIILSRLLFGYEMLPLIFPIIAGFALLGPVAAIGLYELSRLREQGQEATVWRAFDVFRSPSIGAIMRLSLLLFAIFGLWLATAQAMYAQVVGGSAPASVEAFTNQIFNTPEGRRLIVAGNAVGFLFAVLVLVLSAVSFPMLVDRNVSAGTAVRASVRTVIANPGTMALWGLFVAGALVVGSIPFFFGLAVVLPVLGHATWHVYRKAVSRDEVYRR